MINKRLTALIIIIALCISGCSIGHGDYTDTTISVSKKGVIRSTIIESFDKAYYNKDELLEQINKEIDSYCNLVTDDKACVLLKLDVDEQKAKAVIEYSKPEHYAAFNSVDFFYGTVKEAAEKGYNLDITYKNRDNEETIGYNEIKEYSENKMVIMNEPIHVIFPSGILCSTANVDIESDNSAYISSESSGLAYIVLK